MRIQTTYTFKHSSDAINSSNAIRFEKWLEKNKGDSDFGCPRFVNNVSCSESPFGERKKWLVRKFR